MSNSHQLELVGGDDVEAMLDRMAAQISLYMSRHTALIGILRRGAPLAHMLAHRLARLSKGPPEVGELALKRYGDDLELLHEHPELDGRTLDLDVRNRHLILVDDVLYTGESLFRAACFLRAAGASRMHVAVMSRRGHPDMPLQTHVVGCRLDVDGGWIVDCRVPPYEDRLGIVLRRPEPR
jgi:pyrimidine operon attenuation protein/uracil phosphoribosyltransferase